MLRVDAQATKDWLQVAEKDLSELRESCDREGRLRMRAERDARTARTAGERAEERARVAWENEREMREKTKQTEREARGREFENLRLQRQLALFANAVPRSEFDQLRTQLEARIAEQSVKRRVRHLAGI